MKEKTFERTLPGNSTESEGRNNYVKIRGIIKQDFYYSHQYQGEIYYKTKIWIKRDSGETSEKIPVFIQKKHLKTAFKGKFVEVTGSLTSYDSHPAKGKQHLHVFCSVDKISIVDESEGFLNDRF